MMGEEAEAEVEEAPPRAVTLAVQPLVQTEAEVQAEVVKVHPHHPQVSKGVMPMEHLALMVLRA
jgi:hypothetical protein